MTKSEGDGRGGCGDVREKQLIGREGGKEGGGCGGVRGER